MGAATCYLLSNLSVVDASPLPLEIPSAWGYLFIVVSETANFLILHNRKFDFESKLQENIQSRKIKLLKNVFLWKIIDNLYFIIIFVKNYTDKCTTY